MSELPSLSFYRSTSEYGPVPPTVYDQHSQNLMAAIQSQGFFTREIAPGVHIATEGWYFMLVVVHDDGVVVVDAPPTMGPEFNGSNVLNAVRSISDKPITHVIYSHHHIDHIGATFQLGEGFEIVAQEHCAEYVATANDPQRPRATETFDRSKTLQVGGQTIQLDYHGNIHCPGNSFIYLPDHKILMNVDVIFPGWAPFSSLAMAADMRGFLRGHDVVLGYDFDTFVPGHLSRLGNRDDVEMQKAYFDDLVVAAAALQDDAQPGRPSATADVNFGTAAAMAGGFENAWLVFDSYLNAAADRIVAEVLPKWQGKLAAADVFTRSHAWEIFERRRIDG